MKASNIFALPILAVLALAAAADEPSQPRCANCGCCNFKKVCRLVCEMTEDIDYEYDVDYDDYCLPGVSEIRGKKWVPDCKSWFGLRKVLQWQPRCLCKVHTRNTLVKVPVVKKKVPSYNCVVDRVCCQCGRSEVDAKATEQARQRGTLPQSTPMPTAFQFENPNSGDAILASGQSPVR